MQTPTPVVYVSADRAVGKLLIHVRPTTVLAVSAPVVIPAYLDEPSGIFTDALSACSVHVPQLPGFDNEFRAELAKLQRPTTVHEPRLIDADQMTRIYEYTASRLLYGKFDPNNPGHVFVAAQCFSTTWAGIAVQCFTAVLLRRCEIAASQHGLNALEVAIAVMCAIAKCFGCSMHIAPLIPRWPESSGSPPDPIVMLADTLIARFPAELPVARRVELIDALRTWHVPRCIIHNIADYRRIWTPQRQYDRACALMRIVL